MKLMNSAILLDNHSSRLSTPGISLFGKKAPLSIERSQAALSATSGGSTHLRYGDESCETVILFPDSPILIDARGAETESGTENFDASNDIPISSVAYFQIRPTYECSRE
jgi:hypothetical protein